MKNRYEIRGDVTAIFIHCKGQEYEALIDTEDLPKVDAYNGTWSGYIKLKTGLPYVVLNTSDGKQFLLHRVVTDAPKGIEVDHIDGNPLNNRKSNLRCVTHAQNMQNRNNQEDRGVSFETKVGKWRARVKNVFLGYYDTKEEALEVARKARAKLLPFSKEAQELQNVDIEIKEPLKEGLRRDNTSGIAGVNWDDIWKKWHARIARNGKRVFLGYFDSIEDAKRAREEAEEKLRAGVTIEELAKEMKDRSKEKSASGVPGVTWHKQTGKWRARIKRNGKEISLGFFENLEDAICARKEAEAQIDRDKRGSKTDE